MLQIRTGLGSTLCLVSGLPSPKRRQFAGYSRRLDSSAPSRNRRILLHRQEECSSLHLSCLGVGQTDSNTGTRARSDGRQSPLFTSICSGDMNPICRSMYFPILRLLTRAPYPRLSLQASTVVYWSSGRVCYRLGSSLAAMSPL